MDALAATHSNISVKQAAPMCSTHVVSQLRPHETAFAPVPPMADDPCLNTMLLRLIAKLLA